MPEVAELELEQFSALRAEILQRSGAQSSLVQLNLTAIAVVLGALLGDVTPRSDILLLVPILSPALGLFWLDHARAIDRLGAFISSGLPAGLSDWESSIRQPERGKVRT
jgi:hypothetical protein